MIVLVVVLSSPASITIVFQVTILKSFYALNPKPKREELQQIADNIGHPFKVIKVWFQNTRARDSKEKRKLAKTAQALAPPPPPPPQQQVRLNMPDTKRYPEYDHMFRILQTATATTNLLLKTLSPLPPSVVFSSKGFPTPPASSVNSVGGRSPSVSPSRYAYSLFAYCYLNI